MVINGKKVETLFINTSQIDGRSIIKTAWKGIHIREQEVIEVDKEEMYVINTVNVMEEDNTVTQYVTLQG